MDDISEDLKNYGFKIYNVSLNLSHDLIKSKLTEISKFLINLNINKCLNKEILFIEDDKIKENNVNFKNNRIYLIGCMLSITN